MARRLSGSVKRTDTVLVTSVDVASADITGVLPVANGGTGSGSFTDGQLLIGTTSGNTLTKATLTAGSGISVTNGSGSITIAATGGGSGSITISPKTSAYTVVAGDNGSIINCTSGTFTVSLTAAATLGSGFSCWIWNTAISSNDIITVDPDSSETIDGATTLAIYRGQGLELVCDGSLFYTRSPKRYRAYAENVSTGATRPIATGNIAVAIGTGITASGSQSTAIGANATASAQYATAFSGSSSGVSSAASGTASIAAQGGTASGANSVAIGEYSSARSIIGAKVFSNGRFGTTGDAQSGVPYVLRALTTDATATVLTSNQSAAGTTNQLILPNNSAYTFTAEVISHRTDVVSGLTHRASWTVEGVAARDANAASTVVSAVINTISNTPGWTLTVTADTTNGGIAFAFTGEASKTIRTVASVKTSEVTS